MITVGTVDTSGLEAITDRLGDIANLDYTPLVERWAKRLVDDNARFAMAGLDCDEKPMETTVREVTPWMSRRRGAGKPLNPKYRQSRIIRLAQSGRFHDPGTDSWFAQISWPGFTDKNGNGILGHHRNGIRRNPRPKLGLKGGKIIRDVLSRVRPSTLAGAKDDLRDFLQSVATQRGV
jgi:hypothetical protein